MPFAVAEEIRMSLAHRTRHATLLIVLFLGGCARRSEQVEQAPLATPTPAASPAVAVVRGVPIRGYREVDRRALEAGRLDAAWLAGATLDWRRRQQLAASAAATPAPATTGSPSLPDVAATTPVTTPGADAPPIERLRAEAATAAAPAASPAPRGAGTQGTSAAETWDAISPQAFESFQPRLPIQRKDGGPTVLALQQLLDRVHFSPGVIDGRWGKNTEKAVYWLQAALGLEPKVEVDAALFDRLRRAVGTSNPLRRYTVTDADVAGPFRDIPDEYAAQAELECLCYESAAEAVAERFHVDRDLLAKLNPDADLDRLAAGAELWVPDVEPLEADAARDAGEAPPAAAAPSSSIAELVVSKDGFYLQALDGAGRVLYHFPTTVGAGYDQSPSGELAVTGRAYNPTFHYQPKLFADVDDSEAEAMLPAGPNSPVGLVWVQLSKENFGIHGTAEPANIGYTTSHGCVRLTNWDALFLARHLANDVPVRFVGGEESAATAPTPAPAR